MGKSLLFPVSEMAVYWLNNLELEGPMIQFDAISFLLSGHFLYGMYSKPVVGDEVDLLVTADERFLAVVLGAAKKDILFLVPLANM